MIHRLLSPGCFSAQAVFTVSSLLMTMIFMVDVLAPANIRLHVLYIFPLALIALHCDRRSMLVGGFVLSTIFQWLTFFIDGISSVALATDIVIAFLASALTIFLGMRERLLALDGELLIDRAPGKGCRITLNIPLESIRHD